MNDLTLKRSPLERFLGLFTEVRAGEAATALLLAANIFLILTAYYIVKPVREDAIGRAGTAIEQIDAVGQVYETQLREPVMALAERQRQIREQIANYRQSHNM